MSDDDIASLARSLDEAVTTAVKFVRHAGATRLIEDHTYSELRDLMRDVEGSLARLQTAVGNVADVRDR